MQRAGRFLLIAGLAGLATAACGQRSGDDGNGPTGVTTAPSTPAVEGIVVNPGFENGDKAPWAGNAHANPDAFQIDLVNDVVASGKFAVRIHGDGSEPWGGLMQHLTRPGLAGKTATLSASVKGENVPGGIQILAVFFGNNAIPFEHTFTDLGDTFDWRRIEREFDVPEGTTDIEIGVVQMGAGTVWLDDITLVGK